MVQVHIEKRSGCETCVEACPNESSSMVDGYAFIDQEEGLECGICVDECPEGTIVEAE
jgi:NAD-dependent dihydropyrimidine dehydrogenase PreA subunit